MRQAIIKYGDETAGILKEEDNGVYDFQYDKNYVEQYSEQFISFDIPLTNLLYQNKQLFPFFDGL
ncbi:HipA N-terminal domain-containing protein [Halosquirtibacter xylanolyticus]|uniref:HipA N-terminal domain-containing protein n=1 Tax=Halosquirtibacter xylanolyticus TaxID=3374599 RepID=UPI003749EE2F|nr:HipA N-terminal domain-containing protein [Prolixibacteraceae bacterium]